jgi:hypothetical protein
MSNITNGDLNNTQAERARDEISVDPAYRFQSFAIPQSEDDPTVRERYRPFLLKDDISSDDWIAKLELSTALKMVEMHGFNSNDKRLRVLVLHGSMRSRWGHLTSRATLVSKLILRRSYSRLLSYEASRILFRLGCDVRMYDPSGLPMKDDVQHSHPKVQELRDLSKWSDGHIWISPEQHGNLVSDLPRLVAGVGSLFLTWVLDCSFQEPNRLDTPLNRVRSSNPRAYTSHSSSQRRVAIIQHSQLATNPGSLDAHVRDTEPKLYSDGLQAIHRRERRERRKQTDAQWKQGSIG